MESGSVSPVRKNKPPDCIQSEVPRIVSASEGDRHCSMKNGTKLCRCQASGRKKCRMFSLYQAQTNNKIIHGISYTPNEVVGYRQAMFKAMGYQSHERKKFDTSNPRICMCHFVERDLGDDKKLKWDARPKASQSVQVLFCMT
jgi:hypothetical protein